MSVIPNFLVPWEQSIQNLTTVTSPYDTRYLINENARRLFSDFQVVLEGHGKKHLQLTQEDKKFLRREELSIEIDPPLYVLLKARDRCVIDYICGFKKPSDLWQSSSFEHLNYKSILAKDAIPGDIVLYLEVYTVRHCGILQENGLIESINKKTQTVFRHYLEEVPTLLASHVVFLRKKLPIATELWKNSQKKLIGMYTYSFNRLEEDKTKQEIDIPQSDMDRKWMDVSEKDYTRELQSMDNFCYALMKVRDRRTRLWRRAPQLKDEDPKKFFSKYEKVALTDVQAGDLVVYLWDFFGKIAIIYMGIMHDSGLVESKSTQTFNAIIHYEIDRVPWPLCNRVVFLRNG